MMMKIVLRILVLGLMIVGGTNYIQYQRTGHMPLTSWLADMKASASNMLAKAEKSVVKESAPDKAQVKISKWTDANGVVHYENRPVEGAKTLDVDPDTNVLSMEPAAKLPELEEKSAPKTTDEEIRDLQKAKDAYMDRLINN